MTLATAWTARLLSSASPVLAGVALLAIAHCGGAIDKPTKDNPTVDGGTDSASPPTIVGTCSTDVGCPSGSTCYFAIGSCSENGECFTDPSSSTPECGAVEQLCSCDGDGPFVYSGCGYPEGYASGPTYGTHCAVSPVGPIDAGPFDAPQQDFPDAKEPVEAGEDVGPCDPDGECPDGATCYFRIGSCSATGRCITPGDGPNCGALAAYCGCDGTIVTGGCGYPSGYASGPTDGSSGEDCTGSTDAGAGFGPDATGH